MATGKVKWFNNAKGYGFVRPDTGGEDLFVHYSYIQMDGYKSLKAGQPVEFDVHQADKGYHAVNLRADETGEGDMAAGREAAHAEPLEASTEPRSDGE